MKQCYLHLGLHKTATSSIQSTLSKNRHLLKKDGILYPVFRAERKRFINHSIPISLIYNPAVQIQVSFLKSGLNVEKSKKAFRKQFKSILTQNNNILISGEDLSNFTLDAFRAFKEDLLNHRFNLRVIVFVRDPFSLLPSHTQQSVKGGLTVNDMIHHYAKTPSPIVRKVKRLKRAFDEIIWVDFDKSCTPAQGPAHFFLSLLELKDLSNYKIFQTNLSASQPSIRLLDELNKLPLLFQKRENYTRNLKDNQGIVDIAGEKFHLFQSEIAPIYRNLTRMREELEKLCKIHFKNPIPALASYPEGPFIWQEKELSSLIRALPSFHDHMIYRSYDYFFKLHQQSQLCQRLLDKIGNEMDKELASRFAVAKKLKFIGQVAFKIIRGILSTHPCRGGGIGRRVGFKIR